MAALTFKFAGIDFKVEADISDDVIQEIYTVEVWNQRYHKYYEVTVDIEKFKDAMMDFLNEALEDYNLQKKLFAQDLAYDSMRGN